MRKLMPSVVGVALVALFTIGASTSLLAADTPAEKAPRAVPFRGKIAAVDEKAKTLTLEGKSARIIHITSATRITRGDSNAKLVDAVIGEDVTGSCRKNGNGAEEAVSIFLGGKAPKNYKPEQENPK
jgi:Cu/Ag efflux protein CusF